MVLGTGPTASNPLWAYTLPLAIAIIAMAVNKKTFLRIILFIVFDNYLLLTAKYFTTPL